MLPDDIPVNVDKAFISSDWEKFVWFFGSLQIALMASVTRLVIDCSSLVQVLRKVIAVLNRFMLSARELEQKVDKSRARFE